MRMASLPWITKRPAFHAAGLERVLEEAGRSESTFKVYRRFKMINNPRRDPVLYGATG